jgi:hypothetical protein
MENDDYEGIFDDDPVVDNLIYDKVEKDLVDEKKNAGCFTTILAISGCGLLGVLFLMFFKI